MNNKNAEGYPDPTATIAIANAERDEKKAKRRLEKEPRLIVYYGTAYLLSDKSCISSHFSHVRRAKAYVASPYRGDTYGNAKRAIKYSRFIASKGYVPFTPHLLYTRFLNDDMPNEREKGLLFGKAILAKCDALWAFGIISEGMRAEIETAKRLNLPIKYFNTECEEVSVL